MRRPVILVLENSTQVTGALKSIASVCWDLAPYYNFVFVLPSRSKARTWLEDQGLSAVYELPLLELSRNLKSILWYVPALIGNTMRLHEILRAEKVDLVHNNDLYNLLPIGVRLSGHEAPYVTHVRFLPDKFPPALYRIWLALHFRFAGAVIAVSDCLKAKLPKRAHVHRVYDQLPLPERYPPAVGLNRIVLCLANLIPGKGQDAAIAAFAKVAPLHPAWKLKFVGSDMGRVRNKKYKFALVEMCALHGIERQVEWADFTADVEREYKNAAIVINFSESESFSLTCLEAQFYGRPVIATRSGGPAEIVEVEKTGFLVPVGAINAMAEALKKLMDNEALRTQFGEAGRVHVRAKFSPEVTSMGLKKIYDRLLSR